MKLLFDENLSRRLVRRLADLYPESEHVVASGLEAADDLEVWSHARSHGLTIVTRDWDFLQLSTVRGAPPKVIWIRVGNCSVDAIESVLRERFVDVRRFEENSSATLLIIE